MVLASLANSGTGYRKWTSKKTLVIIKTLLHAVWRSASLEGAATKGHETKTRVWVITGWGRKGIGTICLGQVIGLL